MLWIPTVFVCLVSGECAFHYSYVERYLHGCEAVNRKAVHKMQADPDVRAYDVTCIQVVGIELKPGLKVFEIAAISEIIKSTCLKITANYWKIKI